MFVLFIFLLIVLPIASVYASSKDNSYKSYTDIGKLKMSDLTVSSVISNSSLYHGKNIIIDGKVSDLKYKKFFNGRKFTLFNLEDDSNSKIKVYARGFVKEIEDGSKIRIYGKYNKKKKFLFKKYNNVMKAKKIHIRELHTKLSDL